MESKQNLKSCDNLERSRFRARLALSLARHVCAMCFSPHHSPLNILPDPLTALTPPSAPPTPTCSHDYKVLSTKCNLSSRVFPITRNGDSYIMLPRFQIVLGVKIRAPSSESRFFSRYRNFLNLLNWLKIQFSLFYL